VREEEKFSATTAKQQVSILFSCLYDGRGLCVSHRACSTWRILTWCGRTAWGSHNAKWSPTLKGTSCIQRKWKFIPASHSKYNADGNMQPNAMGNQRFTSLSPQQPVPMVPITCIQPASSQSTSLGLYLPVTYPFSAKTRKFNTNNTKERQWTQFWASCIHFACQPTSTFIQLLKTNADFIQNLNTERVQVIRFWILNDPEHHHFSESQEGRRKSQTTGVAWTIPYGRQP